MSSKIGEGGMGVVFLVEHPIIGRKAALKAIHPQFARSAEVVSRFITEARAVTQIGHPHIVDITDFGKTPAGDFYFIMEHLAGDSLSEGIQRDLRFPPERALRIAAQIAHALQASHDHGVIHRDLKPDNIYLVPHDGEPDFVKVLDFGLAKLVSPDASPGHNTRSGSVMGTPYYMAPEQCEGKIEIDHRADVYSLGVILFEMLTGKLPFGGTGYGEVILKHMVARPPALRSIVPELPPALEAVMTRALAKDRELRFQSMSELREAMLDPEAYAASIPALRTEEDHSGRIRDASPMTRTEMALRPTLVTLPEGPPVPLPTTSTLSAGAAEISPAEPNDDEIPRTHYGRGIMLAAAAAAGIFLFTTGAYKQPAARVVAAAHVLSLPPTVRVSFNSDPAGATVVRGGAVVGVTPFSIDVPYADAPSEYVIQKTGFVSKTVAMIPNAPAPIFAALGAEELPDPPPSLQDAPETVSVAAAEPRQGQRARSSRHVEKPALDAYSVDHVQADQPDADETLAPTVQ